MVRCYEKQSIRAFTLRSVNSLICYFILDCETIPVRYGVLRRLREHWHLEVWAADRCRIITVGTYPKHECLRLRPKPVGAPFLPSERSLFIVSSAADSCETLWVVKKYNNLNLWLNLIGETLEFHEPAGFMFLTSHGTIQERLCGLAAQNKQKQEDSS